MSDRGQELIDFGQEAITYRMYMYNTLFEQIVRRMYPRARGFTGPYMPNHPMMEEVRDSTAILALHNWVSIVHGGFTPRDEQWHTLGWLHDPDLMEWQPVREWVEWVTDFLFANRYAPGAGFDASIQTCYRYEGSIGNCCLYLDTEPGGMLYRYSLVPMREVWPLVGDRGEYVGAVRRFRRKKRQIMANPMWRDRVPTSVKRAEDNDEFELQHMVLKRGDFDQGLVGRTRMPFASTYVVVDSADVLHESGYHELPFIFGRLQRDGDEPYGIGLGELALPDVKELAQIVKTTTRRAMKDADPPMFWPDAEIVEGHIDLDPGGQTAGSLDANNNLLPKQLAPAGTPTWGYNEAEQRRTSIRDTFWNTIFQALDGPDRMTATEVLERTRQRRFMVSPVIGQQEDDLFGPMIDRELSMAMRRGLLPPLPEELEGRPLSPVYTSPLARIAVAEDATGIAQTLDIVMPMAQQDPRALDPFDVQELIRTVANGLGVPARAMVSRAAAREKQAARAQNQAQQQQVDQLQQVAQAAGAAAPALQAIQGQAA